MRLAIAILGLGILCLTESSCTKKQHSEQNEAVTLQQDVTNTLSMQAKPISWKDLLAVAIGKSDPEASFGDLVGIHKSGRIVRLSLPNCVNCKIQNIIPGPSGFLIQGLLNLIDDSKNLVTATVIHWNGKEVSIVSDQKVSKIDLKDGLISLEVAHENKLKTVDLSSKPIFEVGSDTWQDFAIQEDGKIFIASSEPWPKIEKSHYFIESGSQLLMGHHFTLDTNYQSPKSYSYNQCFPPAQMWKIFFTQGKRVTRSTIPALSQSGAKFHQGDHHIFAIGQQGDLATISNYAQIPVIEDILERGFGHSLDDHNNLFFDGHNVYRVRQNMDRITIVPHIRLQYDFKDQDYARNLFGPNHGFKKELVAITGDGDLVSFNNESGTIQPLSRRKISYESELDHVVLIKSKDSIYGLDLIRRKVLAGDQTDQELRLNPVLTMLNIKHIEQVRFYQGQIIFLADQILWQLKLETMTLRKLATDPTCDLSFGFRVDQKGHIQALQRCSHKGTLVAINLKGKKKLPVTMIQSPELSSLIRLGKVEGVHLLKLKDQTLITATDTQVCQQLTLSQNHSDPSARAQFIPQDRIERLRSSTRFKEPHDVFVHQAFSWDESTILVNGQQKTSWVSHIVKPQESYQVHPLTGLEAHEFLSLDNGRALVHGYLKGNPFTYIVFKDGSSAITIDDQEGLYLDQLSATPLNRSQLN
ncbi:hypothetical protein [Pseudobacteriovorax antillogorgiicola]|uniref:Uncharacterized protein n=1 Tax=Pseudobacteriovorax antillogorgiicola TaxID=1513793 RepID=A0A1Y6C4G6_9BACT|nr:hypothetical protein [Pseudobacteriovorax antillogorgiicola]TCS51242.1 hypothetical protein EDD56_111127 [Pseudobacteriovorax antillogorgiicola]SMF36578.1 hypothetical protein SAMN06296036_11151 [Pseudobacteriovorax antillogorgiicola]